MKIVKITWNLVIKNLIACSILANFITLTFLIFVYKIGDDLLQIKNKNNLPSHLTKALENCQLSNITDSISYASQLGRLDLVSLLLAIVAIILGFSAIVGFLHIKETSNILAKNSATEFVEKWLEENKNKIVEKIIEQAKNSSTSEAISQAIGQSKESPKKDFEFKL